MNFVTKDLKDCWFKYIFTARKRSLGQGNIFRSMCQEFCPRGGGGAWSWGVSAPGGAWYWGVSGPRGVPGIDLPSGTATATGGTHPTRRHSC